MAHVPETHPSSKPLPSTRTSRRGRHLARRAGILLVLVWVGPVTFVQTDSWQLLKWAGAPGRAAAESQVIPAGMAMVLEPGTILKLRMRDGSVLKGRFQARTLLDSASYAPRFAANASTSAYMPFALGETIRVSLRDGREWTGPFAGYAELALLLQGVDGAAYLRVPFESANEFHRANGDRVEPSDLAQAFRAGRLPSAEALELQEQGRRSSMTDKWRGARLVAVEDIESAVMESRSGGGTSGGTVVGIVVLSVVVSVVLVIWLIGHSIKSDLDRCGSPGTSYPLTGIHRTTRPFDRSRGCYEGDPLAVADPWPGPTERGPASAPDDPAALRAPAR